MIYQNNNGIIKQTSNIYENKQTIQQINSKYENIDGVVKQTYDIGGPREIVFVKNGVVVNGIKIKIKDMDNIFNPRESLGAWTNNSFTIPSSRFNYVGQYMNGPSISLAVQLGDSITFKKNASYTLHYNLSYNISDRQYSGNGYGCEAIIDYIGQYVYSGSTQNFTYNYNQSGTATINFTENQILDEIGLISVYRNWFANQGYRLSQASGTVIDFYLTKN